MSVFVPVPSAVFLSSTKKLLKPFIEEF
jgi:hypothetical protein